jgi:arsenical pump membrane protein
LRSEHQGIVALVFLFVVREQKYMALTLTVFILSMGLVMTRPRPFNEATASALGAAILVILGVISPIQTWEVFKENISILLFFLGLMVISIVSEQAGFFKWCAARSIRLARGQGRALLIVVFILGALITAFFSNDATALILTPIVFALVTRLKLNALPYVFACAFIANTASIILPVSNPVNLLAVDRFGITLVDYLKYLLLPGILVIAVNVGLFLVIFRKSVSCASPVCRIEEPVKIDRFFLSVSICLILIAIGYILVSLYGLPLAYPAAGGAVILLICGFSSRRLSLKKVSSGISWSVLLFIFALAMLVKGLENAGIINYLAEALAALASSGPLQSLFAVTLGTAAGSNLINNWSMMMVSVSSLNTLASQTSGFNSILVYGAIMGADLGPNIAILGSLSSMLWLILLRQRGLIISPWQFLKLGLIITPVMLIIGLLALYACGLLWD